MHIFNMEYAMHKRGFIALPSEAEKAIKFNPVYQETIRSDLEAVANLSTQRQPRLVFLFSGHMIDDPYRQKPRFPASQEAVAARAINYILNTLDAGHEDLAICSGACGGDILFAEASLERGVHLEMRLPFDIATFLENSVAFAGDRWCSRFHAIKDNPLTTISILPDEPGQPNPYISNNFWMLNTALAWGKNKVHFICLWNRQGGERPDGTKQMHDEVIKRSVKVHVLDTNTLFTK